MDKIVKNIAFVALISAAVWPAQAGAMESKGEQSGWNAKRLLLGGVLTVASAAAIYFVGKKLVTWWNTPIDYKQKLFEACKTGDLKKIKSLVEEAKVVDANVVDKDNWTPLHYAAENCCLEIIEYLIEHGAKVNATNNSNHTPLQRALYFRDWDEKTQWPAAASLIENGADFTESDGKDMLLHYVKADWLMTVKKLIEKGVNVNVPDHKTSYLHVAAKKDCPAMVKLLLEHGSNVEAQDDQNRTPIWHAQHLRTYVYLVGNYKITDYLELAMALNEARKDPAGKFDTFVQTYLEPTNPQEASENLAFATGIISHYSTAQNPEFFKQFFTWMKNHNHLKFFKEKHELEPDMKWFYLDLAYQTKNEKFHVKHAWLKKCFGYLESVKNSEFDAAVTDFISRKGIGDNSQNSDKKKLSKNVQEQWDAILREKNEVMQRKKGFANVALFPEQPSKLFIPKNFPTVKMTFNGSSEKDTMPAKKCFRDSYFEPKKWS